MEPQPPGKAMDQLAETTRILRERCRWTGSQSHESLRGYLLEEAHEALAALDAGDAQELRGELGDLLYQVVIHSQLAEEQGEFTLAEVAAGMDAKLKRRSPHVFAPDGTVHAEPIDDVEEIARLWQQAKQREQAASPAPQRHGLPAGLPALALAQKLQQRGGQQAVDTAPGQVQLARAVEQLAADEQSLVQLLQAVVWRAEQLGVDAEGALHRALAGTGAAEHAATTSPKAQPRR